MPSPPSPAAGGPARALAAGCLLAFLGSGVNACFLMQFGTSVSHLTGDVSKVAMNLAEAHSLLGSGALLLITAILGFLLGATLAGYFIHHPNIEFSRPYGRTIVAIGLCLAAAYLLIDASPLLSISLASLGCGTQNALATHYRGMVLRTTHITGLLTDFGTAFGMKLKGHSIGSWKLLVPFLLMICFFSGALAGSLAFLWAGKRVLLLYGTVYFMCGLAWAVLKRIRFFQAPVSR